MRTEFNDIELVIDVGANVGQFAKKLREQGYQGRMVSYEPLSSAFSELERTAVRDARWDVRRFAIGDRVGEAIINISNNSYSSSLLPMLQSHISAAPSSAYVGQENVPVITLNSEIGFLTPPRGKVFLKIDTQGFEDRVLAGATQLIPYISLLQLEISIVPLYAEALLFDDIYDIVRSYGFRMHYMQPAFSDKSTGDLLQVDVMFQKLKTDQSLVSS